jgi:hypothetical protein
MLLPATTCLPAEKKFAKQHVEAPTTHRCSLCLHTRCCMEKTCCCEGCAADACVSQANSPPHAGWRTVNMRELSVRALTGILNFHQQGENKNRT